MPFMPEETLKTKYCFDASAFINGWRLHYKPRSFPSMWDHVGEMMKKGLIVVAEEVSKEIGAGTDDLVSWFKQYKSFVIPINQEQLDIASSIVNKYPSLSEYKSSKVYSADIFVVAIAKIHKYTVVTYEKPDGNAVKPKIPILCKEHFVECCDLATFFEKESLIFDIKT